MAAGQDDLQHGSNVRTTNEVEEDDSETETETSSSEDDDADAYRNSSNRPSNWPEKRKTRKPNSWFNIGNNNFSVKGRVSRNDGRLNLSVNEAANKGYFAKILGASVHRHLRNQAAKEESQQTDQDEIIEKILSQTPATESRPIPKLRIVVMVIGSRGDIQPFIRIAKILQDDFGHRVRIATHPAFKDFIEKDCGLEFFSVGGNPSELMAFMVKNPGLIPDIDTFRKGEIGRRRDQMAEMFTGFWRSCIDASDGSPREGSKELEPFVADAIISNPPVMIHVHLAERLGVPLHIIFTFPYTPTQSFPHPLANIKASNTDEAYTNFISYPLVELMTWTGLGDLVNDCRIEQLGLDPVSTIWAPGQLYRQKVPYTYLWSPSLCPKPKDWGDEINLAGFVFLDLAKDFKPPQDLVEFLDAGEPPVYIGFGSIVVDDPQQFTDLIFEAVEKVGVRAVINKGWGGFGGEGKTPKNIFMLDNVPHDWLFPWCKAVVHHGGAGTTAIGLKCARPTVIVPFFGDQPFWGNLCAAAKAGAHECVPYKKLTAEKLAELIKQCFSEESQKNVQEIADRIEQEGDGARNAVDFFHKSLPLRGTHTMRGSVLEDRAAAWTIKDSSFRLSPLTAELMVQEKRISYDDLRLLRVYEWTDFQGPGGPASGVATAVFRSITGFGKGVAAGPVKIGDDVRRQSRRRKRHNDSKDGKEQENVKTEGGKQEQDAGEATLTPTKVESTRSDSTTTPTAVQVVKDAAKSVSRPLTVIAEAPMEILLGLGQGLHNVPRLYGDETVRRQRRVNGLKSGLDAAGHEFAYESADALSGLVMQPYQGAKDRGVLGFVTGVGKGLGGLVFKGSAAVINPLGLALRGVEKEMRKDKSPIPIIREIRIAQGQSEAAALSAEERKETVEAINKGLAVMHRLWQEGDRIKNDSWFGYFKYRREKQMWIDNGATESTAMSEKVLEAKEQGVPFDKFMKEHQQVEEHRDKNDLVQT